MTAPDYSIARTNADRDRAAGAERKAGERALALENQRAATALSLNPCAHADTRAIPTRHGTLYECRACGLILDPEPAR